MESGRHEELLAERGFYAQLITIAVEKQRKETERRLNTMTMSLKSLPGMEFVDHESHINHEDEKNINGDISNPIFSDHVKPNENSKILTFKLDVTNNEIDVNQIEMKEMPVPVEVERKPTDRRKPSGTPRSKAFQKLETVAIRESALSDQSKKTEVDPKYLNQSRWRLLAMLKDEKFFTIGAACAAACNGAIWPIYGILLADATAALSESDLEAVKTDGRNVAIMFIALALIAGVTLWMQKYFLKIIN